MTVKSRAALLADIAALLTANGVGAITGPDLNELTTDIVDSLEVLGQVRGINTQTGASYTFVLADAGKIVEGNRGSAQTFTVPPNSSVAFAVGTRIDVVQYGAGALTIAAGSGVTIRSQDGNLGLAAQYGGATLYKRATNEWVLIGALA